MASKHITDFFKVTKSLETIPSVENKSQNEDFYKLCLEKQIDGQNCVNEKCKETIIEL